MLQISNLCVSFGSEKVLCDLSLQLLPGVTLLSGPNGSGKSTLLRVLAGLITPQQGGVSGSMGGVSLFEPNLGLYDDLTLEENLSFFAALSSVSASRLKTGYQNFGLEDFLRRQVKHLSTGQKVRGALCRSWLPDASLILFDEPFSGLDEEGVLSFQKVLAQLDKDGKTVLLVAHEGRVLEPFQIRKLQMLEGRVA